MPLLDVRDWTMCENSNFVPFKRVSSIIVSSLGPPLWAM